MARLAFGGALRSAMCWRGSRFGNSELEALAGIEMRVSFE